MKPLSAKELLKILKEHGFAMVRQRGSHIVLKNIISGVLVPVPLHGGNRPLRIGTFLAIVKQSKLPKSAFTQHD